MELNILRGSIDSYAKVNLHLYPVTIDVDVRKPRDVWLHDLHVSYQQCRHAINVQVTKRRQFGRCRARRQCMNTLGLSADLYKMVLLIAVPAAFPKGRPLARLIKSAHSIWSNTVQQDGDLSTVARRLKADRFKIRVKVLTPASPFLSYIPI